MQYFPMPMQQPIHFLLLEIQQKQRLDLLLQHFPKNRLLDQIQEWLEVLFHHSISIPTI
jgi:hypothetical protein